MPNDLHGDLPKTLWQNQPAETSKMSLILIRQKARELRARARRQMIGSLAVPMVVAYMYDFCITHFPNWLQMLNPPFALALAWSIAGIYFLNRGKRSEEMLPEAGLSTGLQFCRKEIEQRRDYFRRVVAWLFAPVVLAIATCATALSVAAGPAKFLEVVPFIMLGVAWIVAYLWMRARQMRQLQRELDELSEIEGANNT